MKGSESMTGVPITHSFEPNLRPADFLTPFPFIEFIGVYVPKLNFGSGPG